MSTSDDSAPKTTEAPSQSSLRESAVKEVTFSKSEIKPASLVGIYVCVWDSVSMFECMDDIGEEDNWIRLYIKNSKNPEDASFADIEGRFQWWRQMGSFKGMRRAKGDKENIWLLNGVSWSPIGVDEDEHGGQGDYGHESYDKESISNDFLFASLGTLDSAGNPFFEMLYIYGTGQCLARGPYLEYVRAVWKKHKEGNRGPLILTEREARRLQRDGAADFRETRDLNKEIEDLDGKDSQATDDDGDDGDDAEGEGDEELESVNESTSLKRRAEEDERGQGVKRHRQ